MKLTEKFFKEKTKGMKREKRYISPELIKAPTILSTYSIFLNKYIVMWAL